MERTLLETEERTDRGGVAAYLRQLAGRLESGEPVTLEGGGAEVELDVPETVDFEVTVEEEGSEMSLELEIEWGGAAAGKAERPDIT
jgi:amphi-Trp domain-containing protein